MAREVNFSVEVDGLSVSGRLQQPTGATNGKVPPAVLLCRASMEASEAENDLIAAIEFGLRASGMAVASFDPRVRRGEREDGEAAPAPDPVRCAAAVFDWLTRRIELDGLHLSVLGHGAGAIMAAGLALANERVHRLCLVSPASPEKLAARLSSRNSVMANGQTGAQANLAPLANVPVAKALLASKRHALIVLGAADRLQQPECARMYEQVVASAPRNVELMLVPFADSVFSSATARQVCVERVVEFLIASSPAEAQAR